MSDDRGALAVPRRRRHLRQLSRVSGCRSVGRFRWRAGVLTSAWALPLTVLRDYTADCVMIHILCFAVRIWRIQPTPAGER